MARSTRVGCALLAAALVTVACAGCADSPEAPRPVATGAPPPADTSEPSAAPIRPASAASAVAGGRLAALPAAHVTALQRIEPDPPPKHIIDDFHFVVSNEKRLHRFHEVAVDRGGMMIGVGPEQNYVLAGWVRPEVLLLMDFDQMVVDVHALHAVAFQVAPTRERFMALWQDPAELGARVDELIVPERRVGAKVALRLAAPQVKGRLRAVHDQFVAAGIPIFLTDDAQYRWVRELVTSRRVHAVRGDLTRAGTLQAIGRVARDLGLVVRVLYMSNAEDYLAYGATFRDNVLALPVDARSIVLRTAYPGRGDDFSYLWQSAADFRRWLEQKKALHIRDMLGPGRTLFSETLIELGPPPPGSPP